MSEMARWVTPTNIDQALTLGRAVVASGLAPDAVSTAEKAMIIIATGAELGIEPMKALRAIHVVKGRPVLSADLMVALVKRSPACLSWWVVESDAEKCTIETQHAKSPNAERFTYTIQMARQAGLAGSPTWRSYPQQMLYARCASGLARRAYPEVCAGLYEVGEGEEIAGAPLPTRQPEPPRQKIAAEPPIKRVGRDWCDRLVAAGVATEEEVRSLLFARAIDLAEGKPTAEDVAAAGEQLLLDHEQRSHIIDVQSEPGELGDGSRVFGRVQSRIMSATGCSDIEAEQAIERARDLLDLPEGGWPEVTDKATELVFARRGDHHDQALDGREAHEGHARA